VGGLLERECQALLRKFFKPLRQKSFPEKKIPPNDLASESPIRDRKRERS